MGKIYYNSPYLAVQSSWLPFIISFALFSGTRRVVFWFHGKLSLIFVLIRLICVTVLSFIWWRDVIRESLLGYHTSKLELGFRSSIILFITSEVFFFISFFWAYYDGRLSPSVDIGLSWPPVGIYPLSVYSVPLLNTIILLSSGVSITWSHHSLLINHFSNIIISLFLTLLLGVYFLFLQYCEYMETSFRITDGIYGRTFFIRTGFHGIHVIVGSTILFYTLLLCLKGLLTFNHHFSFEATAWYWHFVDVVWLFLYISIYWWGRL